LDLVLVVALLSIWGSGNVIVVVLGYLVVVIGFALAVVGFQSFSCAILLVVVLVVSSAILIFLLVSGLIIS
jgi:hypothetical protein